MPIAMADPTASPHGWTWSGEHEADLTGCPTAWTPRRGLHVYFRQPDGEPAWLPSWCAPDGVEVKGQGGNITAPYCIRHDGTFYELTKHSPDLAEAFTAGAIPHVPDWLVEIIRKPRHGAPPAAWEPCRRNGDRYAAYAQAALRGIVTELSSLPSGGRNNALNAAAFRLGRMVARGWIDRREIREALRLAAHANGLLAEDGPPAVDATIQSGLSAGLAKPADEPRARK